MLGLLVSEESQRNPSASLGRAQKPVVVAKSRGRDQKIATMHREGGSDSGLRCGVLGAGPGEHTSRGMHYIIYGTIPSYLQYYTVTMYGTLLD